MSILVAISILLRIVNVFLSLALVYRVRDWRLGFLPPMMILTVLRQTIHQFEQDIEWRISWVMPWSEVPGLFLSFITFFLVFFLGRMFDERDQVEKELEASRAKYYTTFRSSPDAIVITSLMDSKILEVNESFIQFFGHDHGEVVGRTSADFGLWFDPADRQRALAELDKEGLVRDFEARFNVRSGGYLTCRISIEVIEVDGWPATLTVMRDVSERKEAEKEREAFVEELEAKNAELERFTYTVSHDLKSPLLTIRGFMGLLKKDALAGDTERMDRDIERIDRAVETMGRLLDELLELSRVGRVSGTVSSVALAELAEEAVELVRGHLQESGIEIEIQAPLPVVMGDRPRLLEVFQNLLENAIKFMGDQPEPKVMIGHREGDDAIEIFVRDNGPGIDPRYHEKVFGLFDRLDSSVDGTGVGLALVKRIVEVHGGKIWIESEGKGGTTIWFTLPREALANSGAPKSGEG